MNYKSIFQKLEGEINQIKDADVEKRLLILKDKAKDYAGEDKVITFAEVAERIRNAKEEEKIMTGWTDLDRIIGGFRLQQLVVVSALTKSGKTSWCMDLTSRIRGCEPLWLTFEESVEELIKKYLERNLEPPRGLTPDVMKNGELDWIEAKIIEAVVKHGTKVVFIDQLDFIVPFGGDNHALRIGEAMRSLKGMAKRWNVCIFLICHLVKTKMDTQPTMEDLKGSSSIGQEADTVILLWREMKREKGEVIITNNVICSVQANRRHGSTGNVTMTYDNGKFIEQEWREDRKAESEFAGL